ncbi:hypothetical protein A3B21_00485 [Candidatus Uhrbacteria bacterium RIFCSPLOWO2_01_FULL_47_24]|uniref:Uncharacterized protein n=1 Tax=Candidatus Uhrbacteria bacterium RIFCSPLOWO2_01_FULL_47_24 TaxID=1802401 RepID=A0A1F7UT03_9BACT|nr:MAG: hypothetical protein A2753_05415 [Candidatus Uhrbacteria bacterium RIFCSPHIGHO2_01_FULL_47_11]OGL67814.1 MAG: hypothetical protein A3D58_00190 [Candidatus Uhrbacteria bacterium RIFCSPHIGHO2_02_FULL_46_47]OGL76347.1 MAG: hypothetical protein A3F52_01175 [Candidatus Uhrbacteria bacterium RIFCSPHIGHO2_12_FULL_47_11]OGL81385.1 MAG: hypothetical protein A3B21_00485 [Candidatus Uhrbacteria bacterium RIFCSPLOWO2_01_FULL_47_24]OGL83819.1 MAG: hypothetical protein A3J03_02845 [Candidatus Uhrbact
MGGGGSYARQFSLAPQRICRAGFRFDLPEVRWREIQQNPEGNRQQKSKKKLTTNALIAEMRFLTMANY